MNLSNEAEKLLESLTEKMIIVENRNGFFLEDEDYKPEAEKCGEDVYDAYEFILDWIKDEIKLSKIDGIHRIEDALLDGRILNKLGANEEEVEELYNVIIGE